ncbi:MAG TPA: amino acid permease [Holophagaceae bacterium]|nr:amino acid permease [Holophagaceae bacterium]
MGGLFVKKDLDRLIADANDPNAGEGGHGGGQLKRTLGAFNLTMLGIGAIIGTGIFTLTGLAAADHAGPGVVYSFIMGGFLCALAGLCYAEMAAMVPVAGSAYAYSYATMGEFIAWIIGWDLVLEYAFGAITVSNGWAGYLISLLRNSMGVPFSDGLLRFTKGPWEQVVLSNGQSVYGVWNVPATLIVLLAASVLYRGMKESALANNIIVITKVTIVLLFIIMGIGLISKANLFVNPHTTGIASLVPERGMAAVNGVQKVTYGWPGVLRATGVLFFAYIGFDAVSTTAQECKNPARDMPIGIMGSLVICTVLYILVSLTLTGIVHYSQLHDAAPVAKGFDKIVELRHWNPTAGHTLTGLMKLGALAGLSSVILVMMMGQTRVFYAMSKDGLLPWFGTAHKSFGTPHVATVVTGIFAAVCGGLMPLSLVGELVSIGTLLAFVLVCVGVPLLRITSPNVARPFKVPGGIVGAWVVGIAGAVSCIIVMFGLPHDTWIRLLLWLEIGLAIYAFYGWRRSRTGNEGGSEERTRPNTMVVTIAIILFLPTVIWAFKTFGHN